MNYLLRITSTLACLAAATGTAGCSSSDSSTPGTAGARFAVSGVVFGDDTESTYVSLLPSLDVKDVDYAKALEVPGRASIAAYNGWLFVSGGESATITRYSIGEDGSFDQDGTNPHLKSASPLVTPSPFSPMTAIVWDGAMLNRLASSGTPSTPNVSGIASGSVNE